MTTPRREYALVTAPIENGEFNGDALVGFGEIRIALFAEEPTDIEILAVLNGRVAPVGNYSSSEAADLDAYDGLMTGERPACDHWAWTTLDASGSPIAGVVDDSDLTQWQKEIARAERLIDAKLGRHKTNIETLRPQYAPDEFSEANGPWICRVCGNRTHFVGIDDKGCPGPACEDCDGSVEVCDHVITLQQPLHFSGGWVEGNKDEPEYDAFREGPPGTEIGAYTRVRCGECLALLWCDEPTCRGTL